MVRKVILTEVKEKGKENKTNFEDAYLKNGWTDLAQNWYGRFPTTRNAFPEKWAFSV